MVNARVMYSGICGVDAVLWRVIDPGKLENCAGGVVSCGWSHVEEMVDRARWSVCVVEEEKQQRGSNDGEVDMKWRRWMHGCY